MDGNNTLFILILVNVSAMLNSDLMQDTSSIFIFYKKLEHFSGLNSNVPLVVEKALVIMSNKDILSVRKLSRI